MVGRNSVMEREWDEGRCTYFFTRVVFRNCIDDSNTALGTLYAVIIFRSVGSSWRRGYVVLGVV